MDRLNRIARDAAWAFAALTLVLVVLKLSTMAQNLIEAPRYGVTAVSLLADTVAMHVRTDGHVTISHGHSTATTRALVFGDCPRDGFVEEDHPLILDTLLTIRSRTATHELWRSEVGGLHPVGYTVPVTYNHGSGEKSATLVLRDLGFNKLLLFWGMFLLASVLGLLYLGIGAFTLFKQSNNVQARVLALLTLAVCIIVTNILRDIIHGLVQVPSVEALWREALLDGIGMLAYFATAYWLHLAYLFPFPSVFYQNRPRLTLFLCYAPAVIKPLGVLVPDSDFCGTLSGLAAVAMLIQFFAGIVILRRKRKRTTSPLERRQLKAVFLGATLGPVVFFVPMILAGTIVALYFGKYLPVPFPLAVSGLLFLLCLAFLPIPLSLLYAFRKYRLMDVELKLRRGTRFAFTTGGLLVVFFGLLYGISTLLLHLFGLQSGTAALAAGLVLALSFAPVQRRTQRLVEQRFFPERKRLRRMLDDVIASASAMPDRKALWESLQNGLKQGLSLAAVTPVLNDERTGTFRGADGSVVSVDVDGDLAAKLLESGRPLFVDEMFATKNVLLNDSEACCLREQGATVLLPMIIHRRLTGFLILAFAQGQEDIAAEDLNVLASVVSQVALQSENLRLIEENIEKRRLQEQLKMARDVQQRFLPQVLPETPGLQVAARFRSSLEVAGDYYDVVPLADGRTLLAVGDVAGKGAGAAMIMANVQASLRSMAHAGVSLSAIVSGVNDLLCVNTDAAQFVTFFAAVFSPADRAFTCINAGHNPPRMVHSDGTMTLLETGGLCLGIFSGTPYQDEVISVTTGDMLVAFTDGVCEAMNSAEEEFGENRIAELCRDYANTDSVSIIQTVEKSVIAFRGSDSSEDDFTLVVAKVV